MRKAILVGAVAVSAMLGIASSVHAQSVPPFLQGSDLDHAMNGVMQTALQNCAQHEPPIVGAGALQDVYARCLVDSVDQQAPPESVKRMTSYTLRADLAGVMRECRRSKNGDEHHIVQCAVESILAGEQKRRVWAFGPIAENGDP